MQLLFSMTKTGYNRNEIYEKDHFCKLLRIFVPNYLKMILLLMQKPLNLGRLEDL